VVAKQNKDRLKPTRPTFLCFVCQQYGYYGENDRSNHHFNEFYKTIT
jgi:hypothetical protein